MKISKKLAGIYFFISGLGALTWFLIRVIPKPSRANYPCMRAAYPIASAFIVYILSLSSSAFAFLAFKKHLKTGRYLLAGIFSIAAIVSLFFVFQGDKEFVYANSSYLDIPNQPMGIAQGIFPGRVVWTWNPNSTNENCKNDKFGEAYYLPKNTDMNVVDSMVTQTLFSLTGQTSVKEAWTALFKYFNNKHGKGLVDYQPGEKIFIKTNAVGASVNSKHEVSDLNNYTMSRTSPQPVLAILRQLINIYGIPQENISVGDPIMSVQNEYWDLWHGEFPNVNYVSIVGGNGRTLSAPGATSIMFYSDKGAVLRSGDWSDATKGNPIHDDKLYKVIEEADYLISVAALKVHERAGMTLLGKIHFGSHTRGNAMHLHNGLVNPDGTPVEDPKRDGYGLYRVLVDLMGHEKLGGNTLLFVVDGLWGGPGANLRPVKFKIAPFNNDWPSSVFMSQDQVALESVCFDFLKAEFTKDKHNETYPQMEGVDDHLHQSADSSNWPAGIRYDPENDGTVIGSLGVHEHWNNSSEKLYSRNLGTGTGIELVQLSGVTGVEESSVIQPGNFYLGDNYPNPFNPSTRIRFEIPSLKNGLTNVSLKIFDILGNELATLVNEKKSAGVYEVQFNAPALPSGVYLYKLETGTFKQSKKMVLMK